MAEATTTTREDRPARRRFQVRIGTVLLLVVIAALVAAQLTAHRRRRAEVLALSAELKLITAELSRASDRASWATEMYELKYISKAQLVSDLSEFDRLNARLKAAEARLAAMD